jgi:hypothetical protein
MDKLVSGCKLGLFYKAVWIKRQERVRRVQKKRASESLLVFNLKTKIIFNQRLIENMSDNKIVIHFNDIKRIK